MGHLFGGGGQQQSAPPPVAPTIDNQQVAIDAAQEAQRKRSTQGRASTVLTGGDGVTENAPTTHAALLGMA